MALSSSSLSLSRACFSLSLLLSLSLYASSLIFSLSISLHLILTLSHSIPLSMVLLFYFLFLSIYLSVCFSPFPPSLPPSPYSNKGMDHLHCMKMKKMVPVYDLLLEMLDAHVMHSSRLPLSVPQDGPPLPRDASRTPAPLTCPSPPWPPTGVECYSNDF